MYKNYYAWLGVSLAISIGIQMILPYPYGLAVSLGFFLVFPFIFKKIKLGGMMTGIGVSKRCGVCGAKSNDRQCNRCGSHHFKYG